MAKTKKGFMGLIGMLVVVVAIIAWMVYLMQNNWFGDNGISNSLNQDAPNSEAPKNTEGINTQLNDLRQDVKVLQDKKDKEILDELNK